MQLLTSYKLGPYNLKNRTVMAPLTRCRADGNSRVPTEIMADYYRQRATAGLIISEATVVTPKGVGYPATPGIFSNEQVKAWKRITDQVHREGGRIYLQLWHCGRVSHSSFLGGDLPVSSSGIAIKGELYTPLGMKPYETPRALSLDEVKQVPALYAQGARGALEAGFDGVEIHGANGYLIDQFLRDGVNQRTDDYGGSVSNRARLLIEISEAVCKVWGKDRVGLRLSPSGTFNGMSDSDPAKHFLYITEKVSELGLSYLHVIEPDESDIRHGAKAVDSALLRKIFKGTFLSCGGYTKESAEAALLADKTDLVGFGKLFIANPDLPKRFELNKPLNAWDESTFYAGGEKGYTDYAYSM
ncbi:MAG: alkene reductase [Candidatus Omnitrophota bacterium]